MHLSDASLFFVFQCSKIFNTCPSLTFLAMLHSNPHIFYRARHLQVYPNLITYLPKKPRCPAFTHRPGLRDKTGEAI
mgnify:CR=1 FL=1